MFGTVARVDTLFSDQLFDPALTAPLSGPLAEAAPSAPAPINTQRSLDDLGTPLHEVTFCVIDLETTGGNRTDDMITEIGAVKMRGGEHLGTFQTLVNPGIRIPTEITVLTGITASMVMRAPRIETVLPSLMEFLGEAVIVGHNVSFDTGFLNAALERSGRPRLVGKPVDTLPLARRLVRDEVPNCRLGTLADRFRLPHKPNHRALDDALATGDLLHILLERAGTMGVMGLDDLYALPRINGHAQAHKLSFTNNLPREPGVYTFHDREGRVLYVGKATNLRTRVRSYFSGDRRKKISQLLRETEGIEHVVCPGPLEAEVLEVRLIHEHEPRFNRRSKTWSRYAYLKLTLNEPFPRLSVVSAPKDDEAFYLGPLPSRRFARTVADAIETASMIRRCTKRPTKTPKVGPCAAAQIGVSACPCSGDMSTEKYARIIASVMNGLTTQPEVLLAPLRMRMERLAGEERFEEAADMRNRAAALAAALKRHHRVEHLRAAGKVIVELPGRGTAELHRGRLVRSWVDDGSLPLSYTDVSPIPALGIPLPSEMADEVLCVASWLDQRAHELRLIHCDEPLSSPYPRLQDFEPADGVPQRRDG
jgi:DNA polymerase III subunit epsilon